jgi:hypothetical protein
MSQKLVIFGDSFSSDHKHDPDNSTWPTIVAERLNIQKGQYFNYSCAGSSIEYSINKLFTYLTSGQYDVTDIIIFTSTSLNRSPILAKGMPPEHASELSRFLSGNLPEAHPAYEHYTSHADFYKTLFGYTNINLAWAHRFNLYMMLKSLPNTTVLLSGFKLIEDHYNVNDFLKPTEKFFPIKYNLFDISTNEIVNATFYEFHQFFKGECRNCHLCNTNNTVLGNQIADCILNKSVSYFDISKYKIQFIDIKNLDHSILDVELGAKYKKYLKPNTKYSWAL